MNPDDFISGLFDQLPGLIVKVFTVTMMIFHLLFSAIILRQTRIMTKVVEAKISPTLVAVTVIHLLASLFVLIWVILLL